MSTDIKPGQIWQWNSALPHDGLVVTKTEGGNVHYRYEDESIEGEHHRDTEHFTERAHLVTDTAPLDPSKVKAGDTVTLENQPPASVTGVVEKITRMGTVDDPDRATHWEIVLRSPDGAFWVAPAPNYWTLTAHQPAPAPEPEWKPGTVAEGTINGKAVRGVVGHASTGGDAAFVYWNEFAGHLSSTHTLPADVRPLVVIDPADVDVEALAEDLRKAREEYAHEAKNPTLYQYQALRALAHLGIEVPR